MMQPRDRNDLGGEGPKNVFTRGATSGRGGTHEIFSFFEDFGFL
jgi:hypothetical protein